MTTRILPSLLLAVAMAAPCAAQEADAQRGDWDRSGPAQTDPTSLTTAALMREVAGLKELVGTRLDAMDKAIALLQAQADRSPSIDVVDKSVKHLDDLIIEKFLGVEKQFVERDKRTEQLSLADKTAIAAALSAQKEAVVAQNESNTKASDKMEMSFSKLIEQTQALLTAQKAASDDKIDDLKGRLMLIEGSSKGTDQTWAYLFAVAAFLMAGVWLIVSLLRFVSQGKAAGQGG